MNSQNFHVFTQQGNDMYRRYVHSFLPKHTRTVVVLTGVILSSLNCSEAETPDAQFVPTIVDAGDSTTGGRDQPCNDGRCNEDGLICVEQNSALTCRLSCDLDDSSDPCGHASLCRRLDDDSGACFPGGLLDEPCINSICDDDLACTLLSIPDPDNPDGGTVDAEICKLSCSIDSNGSAIPCPRGMTCALFAGSSTNGVCL